jgi:fatty acid desaturase
MESKLLAREAEVQRSMLAAAAAEARRLEAEEDAAAARVQAGRGRGSAVRCHSTDVVADAATVVCLCCLWCLLGWGVWPMKLRYFLLPKVVSQKPSVIKL